MFRCQRKCHRFESDIPLQITTKENMPRQSSEKASIIIGNRYDLILIASQRVRELKSGHRPKLETKYGTTLTALKEIEEGLVGREYLKRIKDEKPKDKKFY